MSVVNGAVKVAKAKRMQIDQLANHTITDGILDAWAQVISALTLWSKPPEDLGLPLGKLVPYARIVSDRFFAATSMRDNVYFCTLMHFIANAEDDKRKAYLKQPAFSLDNNLIVVVVFQLIFVFM